MEVDTLQECEQMCKDHPNCELFQISANLPGRCDLYQMGSGNDITTDCSGPMVNGYHTVIPAYNNQWTDTTPLTESPFAHDGWQCFSASSSPCSARKRLQPF